MFIYNLLNYISLAANFSILIVVYYVYKAIKYRFSMSFNEWLLAIGEDIYDLAKENTKIILVVSFIALLLTNSCVHEFVGIHNLKIKPEGTYCFYVNATRNKENTYTLPAQIRVEVYEDDSHNDKGKTREERRYYIEKIFFTNGGYLEIDDTIRVEIGDSSRFNTDGDEWKVVLLNKHAYSPNIQETNNASAVEIIFLMSEILSVTIIWVALSKYSKALKET